MVRKKFRGPSRGTDEFGHGYGDHFRGRGELVGRRHACAQVVHNALFHERQNVVGPATRLIIHIASVGIAYPHPPPTTRGKVFCRVLVI